MRTTPRTDIFTLEIACMRACLAMRLVDMDMDTGIAWVGMQRAQPRTFRLVPQMCRLAFQYSTVPLICQTREGM